MIFTVPDSFGAPTQSGWVRTQEGNDCHSPAGSAAGGQFCAKEGGGAYREAEGIIAAAREEGLHVLFHSGHAGIDADLAAGVEPRHGTWVDEVLAGATDDEELIDQIRDQEPVAYFDDEPGWVSMKVARKLGKHVTDVTVEDIERHGQLSIVTIEPGDSDFYRADARGQAKTLSGKWDYPENDLPFGVEPGDIFSHEGAAPAITLTGRDLLRFLARNYPEANLLKDKAALRAYADQLRLFERRRD